MKNPVHHQLPENSSGRRSFAIRGFRVTRYLVVLSILFVPAWLFLENWFERQTLDLIGAIGAFLAMMVVWGFVSQLRTNRVVLAGDRLEIHHRFTEVHFPLEGIQSVDMVHFEQELDNLPLSEDQVILEFDENDKNMVLLTLRDEVVSQSPNHRYDALPVKYVTVSPRKPEKFIFALQRRM
jgi:hypothetical protein